MNWLTEIIETYQKGTMYDLLQQASKDLDRINKSLEKEIEKLHSEALQFKACIFELEEQIKELSLKKDKDLKEYWYNKYPKQKTYRWGTPPVNLPYYCTKNNDKVMKVTGKTNDEIANKALIKVHQYMTYTSDEKENWQYANESIERKKGDCFAGYDEIYTKEGVKKIEDIKINDEVLSYDFGLQEYVYKKVISFWEKGELQINRVHFRNGQHIDVSENHPMWHRINKQGESNYEKKYLSEIDLTNWIERKVPIAKRIPYIKSLPKWNIDLYKVIGHYIAEGWSENSKVASSGYELIEHIIPILEENEIPFSEYNNNSGVPCIRFLKSDFKDYLKDLKRNSFDITLYEEIITLPEEYLEMLLYGMWLGDGTKLQYEDKRGYSNNKEWTYSTSSKKLAEDIQRIGLYLGRTFHIWKQENHQGVGNNPIYRINYNPKSHFMKDFGYNDISEVSISYIEKLDNTKMYDLTVEDTHTVVMKNGIITHQCEDGAILMYNIMVASGIPAWRIRLNCGSVIGGGHAYITYLREEDNKWYILDWCYWYDESINFKKTWTEAKKYFGIWFSWNEDFVWIKPDAL